MIITDPLKALRPRHHPRAGLIQVSDMAPGPPQSGFHRAHAPTPVVTVPLCQDQGWPTLPFPLPPLTPDLPLYSSFPHEDSPLPLRPTSSEKPSLTPPAQYSL